MVNADQSPSVPPPNPSYQTHVYALGMGVGTLVAG